MCRKQIHYVSECRECCCAPQTAGFQACCSPGNVPERRESSVSSLKTQCPGTPCWSSGKDSVLPLHGAGVWSLTWEPSDSGSTWLLSTLWEEEKGACVPEAAGMPSWIQCCTHSRCEWGEKWDPVFSYHVSVPDYGHMTKVSYLTVFALAYNTFSTSLKRSFVQIIHSDSTFHLLTWSIKLDPD